MATQHFELHELCHERGSQDATSKALKNAARPPNVGERQ
ncbi:hypothetical protein RISK_003002 [Rhodopirellula islandica]|uniref:Uncharacterized protein n=1 Tax=Rhodopirellula islandica TaxID=595434 RepID=A0A0J1EHK9_RHOIS|nr:hypothetical protein RISK_003002 [Rhodopirellula islandica]